MTVRPQAYQTSMTGGMTGGTMTSTQQSNDVAEVRQAEARFYEALLRLMNGDSGPLKEVLSHREDATAFLGWGGYERGWAELEARWEWARSQFAGGRSVTPETIAIDVSGDLAYTVELEHTSVSVDGVPVEPYTLRVTQVYRREGGEWKVVHRHGDQLPVDQTQRLPGEASPA